MESVVYYMSPILQPFIIIAILTITGFFSALLSVQDFFGETGDIAGVYIYPTLLLWVRLPVAIMVFGLFSCFFAIASKWMLLGKLNNDDVYGIYSIKYFLWNFVLLVVTAVHLLFTEIIRGSPFYNVYLRLLGVTIGSNCYIEALNIPDFDLIEIGDDVYVGPHVILTAHTYEAPNLSRDVVKIGNRCVLNPTCATLPSFTMEDDTQLSSLSLGMKGMTVGVQEIE
jgi:non-ribosomal peptide synthetase-like protein